MTTTTAARLTACGVTILLAAAGLCGAASAQDAAADAGVEADTDAASDAAVATEPAAGAEPAEADGGLAESLLADDGETFETDIAFMRDCLDTLAARGAPARVCVGIVQRMCADEPGAETTAGAAACASREGEVWRMLLDETVASVDASLSNAERETFGRAHDAWSTYRDAECVYEASLYEGGSVANVERAACEGRLTAQRTLGLRERQADVAERMGAR